MTTANHQPPSTPSLHHQPPSTPSLPSTPLNPLSTINPPQPPLYHQSPSTPCARHRRPVRLCPLVIAKCWSPWAGCSHKRAATVEYTWTSRDSRYPRWEVGVVPVVRCCILWTRMLLVATPPALSCWQVAPPPPIHTTTTSFLSPSFLHFPLLTPVFTFACCLSLSPPLTPFSQTLARALRLHSCRRIRRCTPTC